MSISASAWVLLVVAFIAANLPWLSERFLIFIEPKNKIKHVWMRLLEWLLLYFIIGLLALGLEKKITGEVHHQGWEFYSVGFCLFLIFAFPGFIWRHEFKNQLDQWRKGENENSKKED